MADDDLDAAIDKAATILLGQELDGATKADDPMHRRARAAAIEICRRAGVLDVLRAISADGELRPPPTWPQTDIVPVGGGPQFLDVEVRTFVPGGGIKRVPFRLHTVGGKISRDALADAHARGAFLLRKWKNA